MVIDIFFYIILAWALYKGFTRGFVLALLSFFAYLIGLAAALKLSVVVTGYFWGGEEEPNRFLPILSFLLVFAVVILVVNIIGRIIRKSLSLITLGWLDKLAGILLFGFIYLMLYSMVLFYATSSGILSPETQQASKVYSYISPIGPVSVELLGKVIPFFKTVFLQLSTLFEKLGEHFVR